MSLELHRRVSTVINSFEINEDMKTLVNMAKDHFEKNGIDFNIVKVRTECVDEYDDQSFYSKLSLIDYQNSEGVWYSNTDPLNDYFWEDFWGYLYSKDYDDLYEFEVSDIKEIDLKVELEKAMKED